jgi:phosphatidylglycerol:prolipoprotein diacylglycerol transferase
MLAFTKLRERRISFWQVMDYATPFLLLHQAAVRIGCFCRGCCSGKPTNLPWGCHFQGLPTAYHPTQLYEIAYIIAIFAFMRRIYKKGVPNGEVFFATIGLYGVARFFNEFFRPDSPVVFWVINQAQLGLISMVSVCAIALLVITKEGGKDVG